MPALVADRVLALSQDRAFDLVVDIASYPEFIPGYTNVEVLGRGSDRIEVRQTVRYLGFESTFESSARFVRPTWITISCRHPLLSRLEIDWRFNAMANGCLVRVTVDYVIHGGLTTLASAPFATIALQAIMDAVSAKATALSKTEDI